MGNYTETELRTMDFVSLIHPEDREANLVLKKNTTDRYLCRAANVERLAEGV
jgi:hypothetical protein